jgi:hypothetical protein
MPILLPFIVLIAFLRDLKLVFKDREARAMQPSIPGLKGGTFWMRSIFV